MAADLSNGNPRLIFRMNYPYRYVTQGKNLFVWRGSLYCVISKAAGWTSPPTTFLARVHPGRSEPIELLYELPGIHCALGVDSGYLYYVALEPKRSQAATLLGYDADAPPRDTLYRIRLPG